jgi:uncharacterized protein YndB with AHSA1/START domain
MSQSTTTAPIRLSVTVGATPERAFTAFTREMGTWWPFAAHSIYEDRGRGDLRGACGRPRDRAIPGRRGFSLGGRSCVGTTPPVRPCLETQPGAGRLDRGQVTFTSTADGTRVDLEHRGWERFGDEADERRAGYASENGWPAVLGEYVRAIS